MARALVNRTQIGGRVDPFQGVANEGLEVPPFGTTIGDKFSTPNDCIVLEIYNYTNDFLEPVYRPAAYTLDNYEVSIDVESILEKSGYFSGKYNLRARFFRNFLGAPDGAKLSIQEISADRLEVRLMPVYPDDPGTEAADKVAVGFGIDFFNIPKNTVLPNLYLYKTIFEGYKVFDYVQDIFTVIDYPHSIIFKLTSPLPLSVQVDDLVWIAQEVSRPLTDQVTIIPRKPRVSYTYIAPPNYDTIVQNSTNVGTDYKSWDDVLSTNQDTSLAIIQKLFSGSLIEATQLNVDYRKFENYIHFGSAEERLRNFKYKMELLEFYDERIVALSQSYSTTPAYSANSDLTGSQYYVANVLDAKNKKSAIIGGFDSYENYLYYQSSSYESSSFGEFYPTTWPKQNSTRPYVNYSPTSSQAIEWFDGIIASASVYDLSNFKSLRQLIPEHVYNDKSNDQYVLFIDMMGHYFDIIYQYIKQLTSIHQRYESLTEGFAKDLIYTIGQSLGLSTETGNQLDDLWTYVLGTNEDGSLISSTYQYSTEDKTKETWKRIITNLPFLLKTKGTARGIRALINCYGIPSTILRVKEYGGPEPEFNTASQLEYDQFYYGLLVGSGSSQVTIPVANWQDSNGATGGYKALELRFRLDTSILTSSLTYDLLSGPMTVRVKPSDSLITVGSQTFSASFAEDDTDWWYVLVNNGDKAYVGANRYGKAVIYSSSASPGTITTPSTALIPGSSGGTKFYGYVNEFRLWKELLDVEVFENHILAATSFQGSLPNSDAVGSTSSFDELKVRHTFGSDGKKYNLSTTTSVTSSHPDQTSLKYSSGAVRGASFSGYTSDSSSYWAPQVETQYLEYVDGGGSRNIGNKIRIENVTVQDDQLFLEGTIQDSVQDLAPIDSARVSVAFSPTDEVNEDISEQFGGLSLDDFLGEPSDYYRDEYTRLERIKHNYFKKYQKRNNVQGFVRLTENYDSSLFQLIKQFVPERASLQTGLLIESHLLHRNKIKNIKPSYEDEFYETNIQLVRDQEGFIQDMDGDERVPGGYIFDTEISRITETVGETQQLEGRLEWIYELPQQSAEEMSIMDVSLAATAITNIPTINLLEYNDNSIIATEEVSAKIGFDQPSEYVYNTWYQTGSGDNDWRLLPSVGPDMSNPIQPTFYDATRSSIYEQYYDRFRGLFSFGKLRILSSQPTYASESLERFGFTTNNFSIVSQSYVLNNKLKKEYYIQCTSGSANEHKIEIPNVFDNSSEYTYRIRGGVFDSGPNFDYMEIQISQVVGSPKVLLTPFMLYNKWSGFDFRYTLQNGDGRSLIFNVYRATSEALNFRIKNLKIEKITKARVQDTDLYSAGRRTSYYEGCKMTSYDFNIPSPDTIDGGPVVEVSLVNATTISAGPRPLGPIID